MSRDSCVFMEMEIATQDIWQNLFDICPTLKAEINPGAESHRRWQPSIHSDTSCGQNVRFP